MLNTIWPDFLSFRWLDVIDIVLVAFLLFQLYKLMRGTVAVNIFVGIITVYFLWLIVKAFNMKLLGSILGQFIGVGVIALIIVFQQELRRFLLLIGTTSGFGKGKLGDTLRKFGIESRRKSHPTDINAIVKACKNMAEEKTGAIIVIAVSSDLSFYANTGDMIYSKLSQRLIESIFFKNSPLHDGAIIISDSVIIAARCVLPVSENNDFPSNLGMRHRAALGITEVSDAIAIAVSEQTGEIAFAKNGELKLRLKPEELRFLLEKSLEKG